MEYSRKKLLGVVNVDSGRLIITDPFYIPMWQGKSNNPSELRFWGKDEDVLAEYLKKEVKDGKNFDVIKKGSYYTVNHEEYPLERIEKYIQHVAEKNEWMIVTSIHEDSIISRADDITCGKDQGGQVKDMNGNIGLGVAFRSGLGDGQYEVWAYYTKLPDWGERIAKVEVKLIEENNK
jgi:hypothetical protein